MIRLILTESAKTGTAFLSVLQREKRAGVCVLLTKPYSSVKSALSAHKVDPKRFFFIETVSCPDEENVACVSAEDLTALSIAISQALQALPAGSFLVFDSFATLTLHNSSNMVSRFALFIFERLRTWNMDGFIVLAQDSVPSDLLLVLKQAAESVEGSEK